MTQPAETQPAPADTTGRFVTAQVEAWQSTGVPIHPAIARAIAAYWQTPRNAFAPFASTGTVTDSLDAEIGWALRDAGTAEDAAELHALRAYLAAI